MRTQYIENQAELLKELPTGASGVLIAGNGLLSRSADTTMAFRQDSNVLYLSGIKKPNIALLFDAIHGKSFLIQPNVTVVEKIFDDNDNWHAVANAAGLEDVLTERQAIVLLRELSKTGEVYFNFSSPKRLHGVYPNPHRLFWGNKLRKNSITARDVRPFLAKMRITKKPYEVDNILKAIQITNLVLGPYLDGTISYKNISEQSIAMAISADFYNHSVEHAYHPIIATAGNAAVLHHLPDDSTILQNEVLLFDVGAEYDGYAADISRTVVLGANSSIHDIVNDVTQAQKEIISSLKPGIYWKDIQKLALLLLESVANKHDLLRTATIDSLFPHSIGHYLGLDVHDVGDYTLPLHENMIITIEPGLYSKTHNMGIRIEDDILITKSGAKILN